MALVVYALRKFPYKLKPTNGVRFFFHFSLIKSFWKKMYGICQNIQFQGYSIQGKSA